MEMTLAFEEAAAPTQKQIIVGMAAQIVRKSKFYENKDEKMTVTFCILGFRFQIGIGAKT